MERKIGEIFKYNGEWYQAIEQSGKTCKDCYFYPDDGCFIQPGIGWCRHHSRNDNKSVIFKKLEKVGEPYVKRISDGTFSTFQRYRVYNSAILPKEPYIYCNFIDCTIEIEIKQNENMEEKIQHYDCFFDKKESNLKPFDLEAAKAGKPVCTRDGRKARIICYDRQSDHGFPLVALVENPGAEKDEDVRCYRLNGVTADPAYNLMMLPEKKEGWVNVYRKEQNRYVKGIFPSREIALNSILEKSREYIDTIKITWEE